MNRKPLVKYTVRDFQRLLSDKVISPYIDIRSTISIFTHLQKKMRELEQAYDYFLQQRDYMHEDHVQAVNRTEIEVADVFILLCYFCGSLGIDFHSAITNRIFERTPETANSQINELSS